MQQGVGVLLLSLLFGLMPYVAGLSMVDEARADQDLAVWCSTEPGNMADVEGARCNIRTLTRATLNESGLSFSRDSNGENLPYDFVAFDTQQHTSAVLFIFQTGRKAHPNDSAREIGRLLTYDGNRVFGVSSFNEELNEVAELGTGEEPLREALQRRRTRDNNSRLYSAVSNGLDKLAAYEDAARRTLVVLGDGSSGREVPTEEDVVEKANRKNIPVFTIAFTDNRNDLEIKQGLEALRSLAEQTGGVFADAGPERVLPDNYLNDFYHYVENGGEVVFSGPEPSGGELINVAATLSNGRSLSVADVEVRGEGVANEAAGTGSVTTALAASSSDDDSDTGSNDEVASNSEDDEETDPISAFLNDPVAWASENPFPAVSVLVAVLGLGALGLMVAMKPRQKPVEAFDDYDDGGYAGFGADDRDLVPETAEVKVADTVLLGGLEPEDSSSAPTQAGELGRREDATLPDGAAPAAAGSKKPVYAWLEFLDSSSSRTPVSATNVRIGRHRDNDICIANPSVHRQHAVLFKGADGKFVIKDLGTKNGVVVNNVRCGQKVLNDGDLIELGEVRARFIENA